MRFDLQFQRHACCLLWPPNIGVVKDFIKTSSAVAEMGNRGHNRHGPKRGRGAVPLSWSTGNPSNTMWPAPKSIIRTKWRLHP